MKINGGYNKPSRESLDIFKSAINAAPRLIHEDKFYIASNLHYNHYHSPYHALFMTRYLDFRDINNFSSVMVRDGALIVLKFFLENPTPKKFSVQLLIHSRFLPLVPHAWLGQVYFYDYESHIKEYIPRNSLILSVMVDSIAGTPSSIIKKLQSVEATIWRDIHDVFIFIFPYADYLFVTGKVRDLFHEYQMRAAAITVEISNFFKEKNVIVNFPSWEKLANSTVPARSYYLDINSNSLYYSDSYLYHSVVGAWGKPLEESCVKKYFEKIDTEKQSVNHSINVHRFTGPKEKCLDHSGHFENLAELNNFKRSNHELFYPQEERKIFSKEFADLACKLLSSDKD